MIRGLHLRHDCPGDHCRVCWWEGRKLDALAPRPRIRIVARIGLCLCDWCLQSLGESASVGTPKDRFDERPMERDATSPR
jgi:hypothetical protein